MEGFTLSEELVNFLRHLREKGDVAHLPIQSNASIRPALKPDIWLGKATGNVASGLSGDGVNANTGTFTFQRFDTSHNPSYERDSTETNWTTITAKDWFQLGCSTGDLVLLIYLRQEDKRDSKYLYGTNNGWYFFKITTGLTILKTGGTSYPTCSDLANIYPATIVSGANFDDTTKTNTLDTSTSGSVFVLNVCPANNYIPTGTVILASALAGTTSSGNKHFVCEYTCRIATLVKFSTTSAIASGTSTLTSSDLSATTYYNGISPTGSITLDNATGFITTAAATGWAILMGCNRYAIVDLQCGG